MWTSGCKGFSIIVVLPNFSLSLLLNWNQLYLFKGKSKACLHFELSRVRETTPCAPCINSLGRAADFMGIVLGIMGVAMGGYSVAAELSEPQLSSASLLGSNKRIQNDRFIFPKMAF